MYNVRITGKYETVAPRKGRVVYISKAVCPVSGF